MKQVLFIVFFLWGLSSHLSAQKEIDYTIRFTEGVRWVVGEYNVYNYVSRPEYYEIKGDSLIGESYYKKLYGNNDLIALIRNEEGAVYIRILKDETGLPRSLWSAGYWGTLYEDFLLCTYTNEWEINAPIAYTSSYNRFSELYEEVIQEEYLDTVQFANGKYYKKYKTLIYGFGDHKKGPLGQLVPDFAFEGGFCLVELYDNEELVFRTQEFIVVGITDATENPSIRTLYSPQDKILRIDSSLTEETYTVGLFGVDGIKVLSFSGASYDLSGWSPGIYIVRIMTSNKAVHTSKIRIE